MKTQEQQLMALNQMCSQIIKTAQLAPELDSAYYADRVAQSRVCIYGALNEINDPVEDSDEFINDVIAAQRPIIEKLLMEVGIVDEMAETERGEEMEKAPDTLRSAQMTIPDGIHEEI